MSNSRLFMLLCSLIFLFSIFSMQANALYYRQIIINNTQNSNTLTNYQVLITMDTASLISQGKMRSDCGDIRFADSDDSTLLNYWIESDCNSSSTKIWVKVPQIPANSNKTIYLYYGIPNAASASNGDATFDFFDDFNGTSLDISKWVIKSGTPEVQNGILTVSTGATLRSVITFTSNSAFKMNMRLGKPISQNFTSAGFNNDEKWIMFYGSYYYFASTRDSSQTDTVLGGISTINYTLWEGIWTPSKAFFYVNGNNVVHTTNIPSINLPLQFNNLAVTVTTYVDWVFVRKYISPEPSIIINNEQTVNISIITLIPNITIENNNYIFNVSIIFDNSTFKNVSNIDIFWNNNKIFQQSNLIAQIYNSFGKITNIYSINIFIPTLNTSNLNYTSNISVIVNMTYLNETTATYNSSNTSQTYKFYITNCSFGAQTLIYYLKDEINRSSITQDSAITNIKIIMPDGKTQQQFILSNTTNLCIYPAFIAVNATISAQFSKSSYSTSEDIIQTTILSNQSQNKTVYLLPSNYAQAITFRLPNQDYVIYAERLYGDGYTYVKSSKADFNKNAILYLQPYDTYYRIKVFKDDASLCYQTSDFKIASTTYSISSCNVNVSYSPPQIFYVKNVNVSCGFDNTTKNLTCTFVSSDGFDHDVNLIVYKQNKLFNNTIYYNNTLHGTSGTFIVNLQDGFYYSYILTAHSVFDYFSSFVNLASRVAEAGINYIFLIVFIFAALFGFIKPEFGILSIVLLIFISAVIGISFFEIGAIVGLIIAFGLIYFIRR